MTNIAMTIAGSDSSAGAGIQADLKTFSALRVYGTTVITVLTAQNTQGITAIEPVRPEFVRDQINAIFDDMQVDAVKIGMLGSPEIIAAVASALKTYKPAHVVVDPVMVSSSGRRLLSRQAIKAMIADIFPLASLLTPNLDEGAVLLDQPVLQDQEEMEKCAAKITRLGVASVLLKGGHLKGQKAIDVLCADDRFTHYNAERIDTKNTHGTGCTLSAAIAAFLAQGHGLTQAIDKAKAYTTGAIKAADELNTGKGAGPLNHFWEK